MKFFLIGTIGATLFFCTGTKLFAQKKSDAIQTKAGKKYREESDTIRKT